MGGWETFFKITGFFGITAETAPKYLLFFIVFTLFFKWILNDELKPLKSLTEDLETFIVRLCSAIKTGGDINKIDMYEKTKLFSKNSPLALNPEGKEILGKIGFINDINNSEKVLFAKIDKLKPNSALELEELCTGTIIYFVLNSKENYFKKTADYIYNNPEYNEREFYKAAGLYLRDKYLEKHPELLPEEV